MMTNRVGAMPTGRVSGGAFDALPGGPWKHLPAGRYDGFALPAMVVLAQFKDREVGEAAWRISGLELTIRAEGVVEDRTGRVVRVVQLIADEFEALLLFPEDLSDMHLSLRGSKAAFDETAEVLRALRTDTMTIDPPRAAH